MGIFSQKNNKSCWPKVLPLFLALLLTVQVFPFSALAEEGEEAAVSQEETTADEHFFPDYTLDDYGDVLYGSGTIKDNGCSAICP